MASIKPAPPSSDGRTHTQWSVTVGERGEPGRFLYANASLKEVISKAYQVQEYQIVAPDWASSERFDITAVIPAGAKSDQVPSMLQALLAGRFQVTLRNDSKELPFYALTVAKTGLKIKAAESATGITSNSNGTQYRVTAKIPLAGLAEFLSLRIDRLVMDETSLKGPFEIALDWVADTAVPTNDAVQSKDVGPSIFTAVQEQLGLRLESRKGPVKILVVEHAEKPSEN